jgi:hypothetical protein
MTVYKYGNPDRLDVLRRERIRFTQPSALNDPFELYPYFQNVVPEAFLVEQLTSVDITPHLIEAYDKIPEQARAGVSLDDFLEYCKRSLETDEGREVFWQTFAIATNTIKDLTPWIQEQMAIGFGSKIGILSLTTAPDNALMWSHYAAQHRGIVIGFDENNTFFDRRRTPEDDFYWLRQVEYRPPTSDKSMMDLNGTDVLIRKSPEWTYEQEWRMLVPVSAATETVSGPDGEIHLFEFPARCVTELIIGARSSSELQSAAVEIVASDSRYQHVHLRKAVLDHASGAIRIENLAPSPKSVA